MVFFLLTNRIALFSIVTSHTSTVSTLFSYGLQINQVSK